VGLPFEIQVQNSGGNLSLTNSGSVTANGDVVVENSGGYLTVTNSGSVTSFWQHDSIDQLGFKYRNEQLHDGNQLR